MNEKVAVVGAGIVGIANAWRLAKRGARVTLYERDRKASGASVRNFGMVWPIGQGAARLETALLSRLLWDEFVHETGVWSSPCGSLHVATADDEWDVLQEFEAIGPSLGYEVRLLSPGEVASEAPAAATPGLRGGLLSPTELGVDPREVIATAPSWLRARYDVDVRLGVAVTGIDGTTLTTGDGQSERFDRVIVATGADFATLYPELFAEHALSRCKLQMMRTGPQPGGWRLGPMIASGLTLRHYPTFAVCPALDRLKSRVAKETPELDEFGIHVMAAENGDGEVVLGDSHEYGDAIEPFDKRQIEHLMMRELRRVIDLPDWGLAATWHGVYAIQPSRDNQFVVEPEPGVTVVIATGGTGITMSFGLAEERVAAVSRVPVTADQIPAEKEPTAT